MTKVLVAMMILFMAIGPIAHGYLAFKYNALQTLSPEEETHDEKPLGKAKHDVKEHFHQFIAQNEYIVSEKAATPPLDQLIILSKGYAGVPLMPPKAN